MCFLKTLKPLDTIPIEKGHLPIESASSEKFLDVNENHSFSKIAKRPEINVSLSKQDQLLLSLLNLVNFNTQLLLDVDQVILNKT